jgi:hypothetical protein
MVYFPNGSSGEVLDDQCERCPLGDHDRECCCPVLSIQLLYNYDQLNDGQEKLRHAMSMLVDDKGICQVYKQLMENKKGVVDPTPIDRSNLPSWLKLT